MRRSPATRPEALARLERGEGSELVGRDEDVRWALDEQVVLVPTHLASVAPARYSARVALVCTS